jgi:hypothetical protein
LDTIISKIPSRERYMYGSRSIDIGYPWISLGAIIELEYMDMSEFKVIEVGSGGSTVFFSNRCKSIKSLETSQKWAEKLSYKLSDICKSIQELFEIINSEQNEYYYIAFVDSYPFRNHNFDRYAVSNIIIPKIKIGGYFIIDDYRTGRMNEFDYSNMDVFTYDLGLTEEMGKFKDTKICIKKR